MTSNKFGNIQLFFQTLIFKILIPLNTGTCSSFTANSTDKYQYIFWWWWLNLNCVYTDNHFISSSISIFWISSNISPQKTSLAHQVLGKISWLQNPLHLVQVIKCLLDTTFFADRRMIEALILSLPGPSQSVGWLQSCLDCIVLLAGRQAYP